MGIMSADENESCITISHNHWRVPNVERAFSGILEGCPTPQERQNILEETKAARVAWKPTPEGWTLVEQLRGFAGCNIRIQFWDSCMWMLEEEGPYPALAHCHGVTLLTDCDGFLQAYVMVSGVKEFPNEDGYSPEGYFQQRADCEFLLAPFADLYEISRVVTP